MNSAKTAIILANLGGPDGPQAVQPFLQNLFSDPAIIDLPGFLRMPLARLIARRRAEGARANYALMGGGSPLLPETERQAGALQSVLDARQPGRFRTFIAMRHWHPFTAEAAVAAREWGAEAAIFVPLYPQFSITTTGSGYQEWCRHWDRPTHLVCCFPELPEFVRAHAERILEYWRANGSPGNVRLLFSAHGLPEKVIRAGDPYQAQIERTAAAVTRFLPGEWETQICYQSRVGPLKWIGPPTDSEIIRAARDGKTILLVPIAFVSEHIETLVELDIEYRHLAEQAGAKIFLRVPALGTNEPFIEGLAEAVMHAVDAPESICPGRNGTVCDPAHRQCPKRAAALAARR